MDTYWSGPGMGGEFTLRHANKRFLGILSPTKSGYAWYNSPHDPTNFSALTLEEAKQIALSTWAIQESVGVK